MHRRCAASGVSAVPTGAFNVRFVRAFVAFVASHSRPQPQISHDLQDFASSDWTLSDCAIKVNWVSPHFEKEQSHCDILHDSLAKCPFFYAPCWQLSCRFCMISCQSCMSWYGIKDHQGI